MFTEQRLFTGVVNIVVSVNIGQEEKVRAARIVPLSDTKLGAPEQQGGPSNPALWAGFEGLPRSLRAREGHG